MSIQPYLFFGGRCEEALEFYKESIGAQVDMLLRFSESPEPPPPGMVPAGFEKKVMHASFRVGDVTILASDGCEVGSEFKGFSLAMSAATEAEVKELFEALADGGTVGMPLAKTFWSPLYGKLTDRFGVGWMVMVKVPLRISVETTVNAPVDKVWRAWTTPEDIMQWNAASEDWHTPSAEVDLRVGGRFSSRMEAKDQSMGFNFSGTFTKVVEHKIIEYSMEDGRSVLVEFLSDNDTVTVRETFDAESENSGEQQRQGWQAILNNFTNHVESKRQ